MRYWDGGECGGSRWGWVNEGRHGVMRESGACWIFSLDFWVVERKHTFLVFYCYTVKQYRGNWHKLVLLAVYQNHLQVENNEKLADVKSVLKLLAGFVQTDISTASAKWRSLLWIVSNFHMSRVTRLNSHKFWPRCHVTLYEKAVTCRPTLPNSSL